MTRRRSGLEILNSIAPVKLRGRWFLEDDLKVIRRVVSKYKDKGRTEISRVVCVQLDWRQPNGWLKDRACREVLARLERMGIVSLPPRLVNTIEGSRGSYVNAVSHLDKCHLATSATVISEKVRLEFSKGNEAEKIWNELIERFHYLGWRPAVGRCIKYLVKSGETIIGAISFSSPAWRILARDRLLEQIGLVSSHDYVINNSRFLLLPVVQVPNLASHVLSLSTKQVVKDWGSYYAVTPLVVETFVDPTRYRGTCYRAANWKEIGTTKGYAKRGALHRNSQYPKLVFLYGLNRKTRSRLHEVTATSNHRDSVAGAKVSSCDCAQKLDHRGHSEAHDRGRESIRGEVTPFRLSPGD